MADELNGQALPFTIQNLIKITIFKTMAPHGALVCDSENWCTYSKRGLFFPVLVCFIYVFDQTLAEQLYRDKGLLTTRSWFCPKESWWSFTNRKF